jgi:hypothetical protein
VEARGWPARRVDDDLVPRHQAREKAEVRVAVAAEDRGPRRARPRAAAGVAGPERQRAAAHAVEHDQVDPVAGHA